MWLKCSSKVSRNSLMVLTHCNWTPMKCLFTPRAFNSPFEGANLSYSCTIYLFMTCRYRKCMKKMNYNERGVRRPHTPFTAVFHLSVPVVVFDVQIYGRPRQTDGEQPYLQAIHWCSERPHSRTLCMPPFGRSQCWSFQTSGSPVHPCKFGLELGPPLAGSVRESLGDQTQLFVSNFGVSHQHTLSHSITSLGVRIDEPVKCIWMGSM
jgi:hypothetical protein